MSNKLLYPTLRMVASGVLSLLVLLFIYPAARHDPRWLIGLGGVAAGAFVLLVPVMVRGDSWQKMVAGALLCVPCLGLIAAFYGVVSSL